MFTNKLTSAIGKATGYIQDLKDGIELNRVKVSNLQTLVNNLKDAQSELNKEITVGKNLLDGLNNITQGK